MVTDASLFTIKRKSNDPWGCPWLCLKVFCTKKDFDMFWTGVTHFQGSELST